MKITYDSKVDVMYIYLSNKKSTRTEVINHDLMIDFNGKKIVGIEILDASEKIANRDLKSIDLQMLSSQS